MLKKLNLGCGSNKIKGYVNIDVEKSCKPDKVFDFTKAKFPYKDGSISEVLLFHTIEHIQKRYHSHVLSEIHRVLKPKGKFIVSFPEFSKCYENWKSNKDDQRRFWEATLFGRQLYPSDHHVCIMDSVDFTNTLLIAGFHNIEVQPEPDQDFNTFIICTKGQRPISYEETIRREMNRIELRK